MLDFHCHLIPGVDDGAETIAQSRDALAAMLAQGIRTVITTPHIRASLFNQSAAFEQYMDRVQAGWTVLCALAAAEFPTLRLERGFEVMLDVPRPDVSDPRLRLAGSRFVLVEFPSFTVPPNSVQALFDLRIAGYIPVIAHPERYVNLASDWDVAAGWRTAGSFLQINAGSLLGQYGNGPKDISWKLLERGWADFLCSDYHARGECGTSAACGLLEGSGGRAQADLMTRANPGGVVSGDEPEPVPPLRRRGRRWWKLQARSDS